MLKSNHGQMQLECNCLFVEIKLSDTLELAVSAYVHSDWVVTVLIA